jgi:hypothetical protein
MYRFKKGLIILLGGAVLFGSGISSSHAASVNENTIIGPSESSNEIVHPQAIPVTADISPRTKIYTGTSAITHTVILNWGGGTFNTYYVKYWDGKEYAVDDSYKSYEISSTQTYNRGSVTEKTWNTRLDVRNGIDLATVDGYVKLTR